MNDTPTPDHDASTVRQRMAAASARIARLKRLDRAAVLLITLGGIAIIAAVLGILLFIGLEAVPLFRAGRVEPVGTVRVDTAVATAAAEGGLRAVGVDEYQTYVYTVEPDARLVFWSYADGQKVREEPIGALAGARVVSSSRSLLGDFVAVGTDDGRVALLELRFRPVYEGQTQTGVDVQVADRGLVEIDPGKRSVRDLSYREGDGRKTVAAVVADDEIALWWTDENDEPHRATLRPAAGERFTLVRLGHVNDLVAGTSGGKVYHWSLDPEPVLDNVSLVGDGPITALGWALGDNTFIAGTATGTISGWIQARLHEDDERQARVRVHEFAGHRAAVTTVSAAARDKSFVTTGADGSVVLRHLTAQRTIVELPKQPAPVAAAVISPKNDGIVVVLENGTLSRFSVASPHPETTLRTLFGRVWYEGYPRPEFVWQSTGATDDFESKLSLVPLIFGTIKATVYALLFAIPLGVLGALYTSQFVHPSIRSKIKPTVEIMAALPSVVIGFLAGLWMAGIVERNLVAVIIGIPAIVLSGTSGVVFWGMLPERWQHRLKPGTELLLILPLLVLGGWLAAVLAPWVERAFFGGDLRLWLNSVGFTYGQRNSLVVGLAMGFAVIPIIFTISDDAFTSVPQSLTAASLALGASRWQTAMRIVVPTASPGVFSAVMVGFGRAVGETMIVLMATGNTPVLDWSIFNGMRTLSANIAVEIPEAPVGGTLYRVLFLSAALLFTLTFVLNTIAELIRQRLRDKYKAI